MADLNASIALVDLGKYVLRTGEDMATISKVRGVVAGQYGQTVPLSVVNNEGQAVDLSAYTVILVRALSEDAQESIQWTGAFVAATGGTFSFTPDTALTFIRPGTWEAQAQFSDTGILALTVPFEIIVEKQI